MNTKFKKFHTPWNKGKKLSKGRIVGRSKINFDLNKAIQLYKTGLSLSQIGKVLNIGRNTIKRRFDDNNISIRSKSETSKIFTNKKSYKIKFSKRMKKFWSNKDNHERMVEIQKNLPESVKINILKKARLAQGKKNKVESKVEEIVKDFNFKYVGDGKFFIGRFNPDFINVENKLIIEVYGDYWHNLPQHKDIDRRRLIAYKNAGFKTLIIWEHELKNLKVLRYKIERFIL